MSDIVPVVTRSNIKIKERKHILISSYFLFRFHTSGVRQAL